MGAALLGMADVREAVAAAMTILSTGPRKDGYAYSVLEEATADPNPAGEPKEGTNASAA